MTGVLGKIRLLRESLPTQSAILDTRKSCCRADTLFFSLEQQVGRPATEEIKHIAPAHLTPADGRAAFENGVAV